MLTKVKLSCPRNEDTGGGGEAEVQLRLVSMSELEGVVNVTLNTRRRTRKFHEYFYFITVAHFWELLLLTNVISSS